MNKVPFSSLSLLIAASAMAASASLCFADNLIPAGSLIQCSVSEAKISSKTEAVGDPLACKISSTVRFGHSILPYDSFMIGRFEDFKDPGHLVGKGWMELKFDHMVIQPDTVIPIDTKVISVPGYPIDRQGRIHGKGHPVRDTIEWTIPILWPIDLINLPRRGPRPTLKNETRLTLKVMDDIMLPSTEHPTQDPYGLLHRSPTAYSVPHRAPDAARDRIAFTEPRESAPEPNTPHLSSAELLTTFPSPNVPQNRMPYPGPDPRRDAVTLVFNDGRPLEQIRNYVLTSTALYVLDDGRRIIPLDQLDMETTQRVNRDAGIDFGWRSSTQ